MRLFLLSRAFRAAALVSLFSVSLYAQAYQTSLTGLVTDPSNAVITNTQVVLTDEEKGFKYTTTTDGEGRYILRNIPPGRYTLAVSAPGMRQFQQAGIVLTVGQNFQANAKLELQGAVATVDIQGTTSVLLQAQDASTGQIVNRKFINDLPLTSRSVFNLAQMAPGVTQAAGGSFGLNAGSVNFISNGGRNSTADIVMDGASQTNQENNSGITTALYTPPVDAVQEFNVQQNTYSADIGFGGNTVINVVTRSGSNQFHGSAYEFLQNSALNANNYFNNQAGSGISPLKQNQFGGTFGGPIRKDKTFFFADYQGTRTRRQTTARAGVPSLAERNGDFGEVCTRNGGSFDSKGMCSVAAGQIWDPYSSMYDAAAGGAVRNVFVPFNNLATFTSQGNPKLAGTPYALPNRPGNLIDPVAFKMMQYFPLPNLGVGASSYNYLNNWIGSNGNSSNNDQFDIKIDHRLSETSTLSGRFSQSRGKGENVNCFGNVADPCTQGPNDNHAYSTSINFNHTFSPTLVLSMSYGYVRSFSFTHGVAEDFQDFNPVTTLGLPEYMLTSGYIATPNVQLGNGYQAVSSQNLGSQTYSILRYPLDTHNLTASINKIRGNHEFKAGYELRMHRVSFLQVGNPEGNFNFNQSGTSQNPSGTSGGDALASLLIGFPQGGNGYGVDVAVTTQNFAHAWYLQDNWRPTSRLTVNLGFRYELTLPRTERFNRMSWIDPDVASPLQGVPGFPNLKGGLVFASDDDRSPYNVNTHNFGPRIGLAYRIGANTVIRTGYGIFYDAIKGAASGTGGGGFSGFNWTTPLLLTAQNDGATPWGRLSNPFPSGIQTPPGSSQGLLTGLGLGISGPVKTWNDTPYMQTWNFGVQREFKSILVDVNYVGTKGTHLYFGGATGQNYLGQWVETAGLDQITQLNTKVDNPFYGIITNPASPLSSKQVNYNQLLREYPQFNGFSGQDPPIASSIYHALQVRVEKRFSKGLQLLGTYVYSKSIDNSSVACSCTTWLGGATSLQDPNRLDWERSVSQFDIPQVLQFSYTYDLPIGKGKRFGSNWRGLVNTLIGGWQTNGLWRFDNGMPLALSVSTSQALPTYGNQRPNLNAPLQRNNGSDWLNQYFANPQDAVTPARFTVGNAPREISSVRAPGTSTTALSLFKQFALPLREGTRLEFRVEAFNALNHPQFAAPNLTVGSDAFGKVTQQANSPRQVQLGLKLYF